MKYKVKLFWIRVLIAGLVMGSIGVVQYMFLDFYMENQWIGFVQLGVFGIILALLFRRASFIGSVYSSIISSIMSVGYLLMNWDGYLAYVKDALDSRIAEDPKIQAYFDANPLMYETQINPPQWTMLIGVVFSSLIIALFALLFAWLFGSFRKKKDIFIPETLLNDDGTLPSDAVLQTEIPSEPIPPSPPPTDR